MPNEINNIDYDEIDYKICGELEERLKALDDFATQQT